LLDDDAHFSCSSFATASAWKTAARLASPARAPTASSASELVLYDPCTATTCGVYGTSSPADEKRPKNCRLFKDKWVDGQGARFGYDDLSRPCFAQSKRHLRPREKMVPGYDCVGPKEGALTLCKMGTFHGSTDLVSCPEEVRRPFQYVGYAAPGKNNPSQKVTTPVDKPACCADTPRPTLGPGVSSCYCEDSVYRF
jgi:hypothetical protein